jgi:putative aldouronate transport system substrate-binding protein
MPELANGTPAAFLAYPESPVTMYAQPPTSGGSISITKIVDSGLPPSVNKNPYWQELNKRVGADLKIVSIPAAEYGAKINTALAGGGLSDLVQMPRGNSGTVPHEGDVLAKEFQNLSPWLAGDAVKQYPSLAALPTYVWPFTVFDGAIYGVPFPVGAPSGDGRVRQDILDARGIVVDLANGEDFLSLCQEVNDPNHHQWALDTVDHAMLLVGEMVGAPNGWKEDSGSFVCTYETDEYKRAIDISSQIWKAGYVYPDSLNSTAGIHDWFTSGAVVISYDAYTNWSSLQISGELASPTFEMAGLITPKWEGGGQAAHYTGGSMYTMTCLKKTSNARTDELLRVLDWFAAPFGSEEYLFRKWGLPGRDYTLKGSDPVPTQTGTTEVQAMGTSYIATALQPLYTPGYPDVTKAEYTFLSKLMNVTVPNPTAGLTSDTQLTKGAALTKEITGLRTDIIVGRKPLSAWADGVKKWKSNGGDAIAREYAEQYAQYGSG